MKLIQILNIFVLLVLLSPQAIAESPFKGGMKYTAVRKSPNTAPAQTTQQGNIKRQNFNQPDQDAPQEAISPAEKVWKKYKALASGQAEKAQEDETTEALENPETPSPPKKETIEAETTQPKPTPPTGFAAIINKYHQNKEQRGQLRIIRVEKPESPKAPIVEKTAKDTVEN